MTDRRFPRSVYGVGDEPDPRFSLANERTFLAWIRTALALLAVGVAIEALALGADPVLRFIAGLIFIALGAAAAVYGWVSWLRTERALRQNRALSGPTAGVYVVVGVVVAILLLVAGMLL
ncbi:hypothetical protein GCM10022200_27010 [Microbacterium awajiense]|uniref:DUF202 domain-containing protein n=1 Tax=Microbacterium awajiense TaxID=415214 RepID=A0ABP7AVT2_9MICO